MLPNNRIRLGPKVTLKLSTPSSLSAPQLASTSPDTPTILPVPIPIPIPSVFRTAMDTNVAQLTSDLPHHASTPLGVAEVSTPPIPQLPNVNGPFRIWRQLSAGGFAKTMGAEDMASGRVLCLKVFMKSRLEHTERGLRRELEVYKRIASSKECCPGMIFLMELEMSFQTSKKICFAMNRMANDLLYYMENESAYCIQNARRWSAQLAFGIHALHTMGIIHRDIKSENVLIDTQENVRIADFGVSYIDKEPKLLVPWRDYTSDVKGTTNFMAPEILRNRKNPDPVKYGMPVDWWAFGCVLYELLSPPDHKVLFDSSGAIMKYVSWHSEQDGKSGLFPAFHELDPIVGDLVAGLLNPSATIRYGIHQVVSHQYYSNDNGTSEFHGACSRALQREKQPQMLPDMYDESVRIWFPLPPGQRSYIENVDWKKPTP